MNLTHIKTSTSIRIDANLLSQIRKEAKTDHRSLGHYLETLLYRWGHRPYNNETAEACSESRKGRFAGVVDTSSQKAFVSSILGSEKD